jgi:predicted outer membrane repeat protein
LTLTKLLTLQLKKGGGLYITNGAVLNISKATFISNNATKNGGAMAFENATASLASQTMANNIATSKGNDIYIDEEESSVGTFVDCLGGLFPNLFCDGLAGIVDDGSIDNTNCDSNGATSGTRCNLAQKMA